MPQLPDVLPSDRSYKFADGQSLPPVAARLPIRVQTDGGATVEFPAGTPQEIVAQTMRRHSGSVQHPTSERPGMFDDLIPPSRPRETAAPTLGGPTYTPVDHDPFAQSVKRGPTYTPVDHDPFASARPAGMFDDLIPQPPPLTRPGMFDDLIPQAAPIDQRPTVGESGRPRVYIGGARPDGGESAGPSAMHSFAVGAQGVGAGVRDIAMSPFDLAAGAQNIVTGGINKVFGTNIPAAMPASKMLERATEPLSIAETDMSPGEKLGYNINRFGTQALGSGALLAMRAPAVAEAVKPSPTATGRFLDTMARPYTAAPARTLTGDAIGGAGAGVAVNAAQDYLPTEPSTTFGHVVKETANFLAPLAGGLGANTAQNVAEGLGGMLKGLATRAFASSPHDFPLNTRTREPFSSADINRAATQIQASTVGAPRALAQDIRENAGELRNARLAGETPVANSALPTSGLLSRDPGLLALEGGTRSRNNADFIQRDQNVKEAAALRVDGLRDEGADLGAVLRRAGDARKERVAPTAERVQQFEDIASRTDQQRALQGAEFGAINNSEVKANASRRLDTAVVDGNYIPARAEKNRQFAEAPGRNDQLPAGRVFDAIDRVRASISQIGPAAEQLPGEFIQRLDWLRPRIDLQNGANVGGPGTAAGGDLADLRKYLNTAQDRAQRGGNFDLADNIGQLRRSINDTIGDAPGYAEANANYGRFADRFRPERNDEMAKFTSEIDRGGQQPDGTLNRGGTPPSETAGRFLSSPEKSAALQRVLSDAPNAAAGQAAVRYYMRSNFAASALNVDGTLNPARVSQWSRNNTDVLAQFPALRTEFDGYAPSARRGHQLSTDAQTGLDQARASHRTAELEVDRSVIGTLLRGEDPRDVASKLLGGGYSAEKRLDEIAALVKNDAPAARGWKAAVAEVLADKVQGSRMIGEAPEVQFARLAKEFKDNEALLAKTFSPEEMNGLRQAHKLLEYFKEAEKRATVGSNTADKWNVPGWAQLAVRHFKGDLAGGGLIKRFKLLLEQLPSNKQSADEIVHMAWFNPDVAAYLLERPIKSANVPVYNINLRRLLAVDSAARESEK